MATVLWPNMSDFCRLKMAHLSCTLPVDLQYWFLQTAMLLVSSVVFNGAHRPFLILVPFALKLETASSISPAAPLWVEQKAVTLLLGTMSSRQIWAAVWWNVLPQSRRGCHGLHICWSFSDGLLSTCEVRPNTFLDVWKSFKDKAKYTVISSKMLGIQL